MAKSTSTPEVALVLVAETQEKEIKDLKERLEKMETAHDELVKRIVSMSWISRVGSEKYFIKKPL